MSTEPRNRRLRSTEASDSTCESPAPPFAGSVDEAPRETTRAGRARPGVWRGVPSSERSATGEWGATEAALPGLCCSLPLPGFADLGSPAAPGFVRGRPTPNGVRILDSSSLEPENDANRSGVLPPSHPSRLARSRGPRRSPFDPSPAGPGCPHPVDTVPAVKLASMPTRPAGINEDPDGHTQPVSALKKLSTGTGWDALTSREH